MENSYEKRPLERTALAGLSVVRLVCPAMQPLLSSQVFWPVFAAVIGANLLTVMFVWGIVQTARREANGEKHGFYLAVTIMPLAFAAAGLMIALDSVPPWLDAALQ